MAEGQVRTLRAPGGVGVGWVPGGSGVGGRCSPLLVRWDLANVFSRGDCVTSRGCVGMGRWKRSGFPGEDGSGAGIPDAGNNFCFISGIGMRVLATSHA